MNRKLLILLSAVILCVLPAASAQAGVMKDEVIYALLSPEGLPGPLYAVSHFEAPQEAAVSDFGAYSAVMPLGDAEDFRYQDGAVTFVMQAGRFSYQGTLTDRALPWVIRLAYFLDGQPVAPSGLSGAQGRLRVTLNVTPLEEMRAYADSLTLQVTVTLDGDKCLDIQAERATQAVSGGDRTLSYVILPGQAGAYAFSCEVRDFSMPGIQAAGIRMGMDREMYAGAARRALAGSPLEAVAGGFLGSFLSGMEGQAPASFTDSRNAVRSLQFVLLGEAIGEKPAAVPEAQTAKPDTALDRLLRLFGL